MASRIAGITIEIGAETTKLSSALKGIDKDLKSTQSSLKDVDKLLKFDPGNTELLTQKQKLLGEAIEETKDRLDVLNSVAESGDLGAEEYDALQREIIETQGKLESYESQLEENQSATDSLTSTISEQQSELDDLKSAYVDAVLEFGEGSDEANALADSISEVSGELKENQDALSQAQASADSFDQTMQQTTESEDMLGAGASEMASLFGGSIGSMASAILAGGVAGSMSEIIDVVKEVGSSIVDAAQEWDEACEVIAQGTGATGEALDDLAWSAREANAAVADADSGLLDSAGTLAELNTRLGLTGDEAESATEMFLNFAKATGEDSVSSVDSTIDAMKRWNQSLDETNIQSWLDDITTSSQACSLSAGEMTDILGNNAYQFQELGYSTQDALGFITAFADGGGNTSQITTALRNSVKNLTDVTDDVPGTFQTAMDMIEASGGSMDVLNQQVGDTGLTIEDVFGTKAAQEMVGSIGSLGESVDTFSSSLEDNDGIMQQTADDSTTLKDSWSKLKDDINEEWFSGIGTSASEGLGKVVEGFDGIVTGEPSVKSALEEMSDGFGDLTGMTQENMDAGDVWVQRGQTVAENASTNWENLKTNTVQKFEDMKTNATNSMTIMGSVIGTKSTTIKTSVETAFDNMKTNVSNAFTTIASSAQTHFENLRNTISTKIGNAKDTFTTAISNMRNALNFSWSLPHLNLPHISVSGGVAPYGIGGKGSLPQFHISWYAKAMEQAMILRNPTIFGSSGGSLLGAGEAGNEVVSGEAHLVDLIRQASGIDYDLLADKLAYAVSGMGIYLDGNAFVGQTVNRYDAALGKLQNTRGRGR